MNEYLTSTIPYIKKTAESIEEYKNLLKSKKITKDEFKDLVLDCTRLDIIDKSLYNYEAIIKISAALDTLAKLAINLI